MMANCVSIRVASLRHFQQWRESSLRSLSPLVSNAIITWRKQKVKSCSVPICCTPLEQNPYETREVELQEELVQEIDEEDFGVMCEPCNGRGWLLCDFCQGKKTYVKAENNRIYRRCPTCRAVGCVICSNCKVFKCVTFPDYSDGEL